MNEAIKDLHFLATRLQSMAADGHEYFAQADISMMIRIADAMFAADAQIAGLRSELSTARNAALEEAAEFIDAHAALEKNSISDLSEKSDPSLTKQASQSVSERNARRTAQAAAYGVIATAIRALKEDKP